jgi:hypothetical protein
MTRDEITRMAKEAGFCGFDGDNKCLREFAALVIAAERQRKAWDATYWTAYEQDVAAAEREACAQIAHNTYEGFGVDAKGVDFVKERIIAAIRARGQV